MLFPTATFAIFFLVVLPLSWLLMPHQRGWRIFIAAASYVFYGWWDWRFVFLLAGSTLGNWLFAQAIHRQSRAGRRKALLWAAIVCNLGVLGYFKYYDFFLSSATNAIGAAGLNFSPTIVSVVLPIGISFFTFMALSYVIDVYRGDFEPTSLPIFAVYLSFFPHLIAGPIVRASELVPQLGSPRDPRRIDTGRAFFLIGSGLFMKVVIANFLATDLVDGVFAAPNRYSSLETFAGVYGYAVQIFADFLGYTNIAIGLALLLGFRFPQNFDSPYTALSIQDFWRRWHMTLSRWFRDYLYIPLGGNRHGRVETYRNLLVTMLLAGLWHGAAWTFIAWGAIHGTALVVEHWRADRRRSRGLPPPSPSAARNAIRRILTFNLVCFAWIFFRADSFADAGEIIGTLFSAWGEPSPAVTAPIVLAIVFGVGVQYVPRRATDAIMASFSRIHPIAQTLCLAATLMMISVLGPEGVAPFIYFQF